MKQKQTILVIGATGAQGGSVAESLLQSKKFNVRILTRNPTSPRAKALEEDGAEIYKGDLDDVISIRKALQDVYGVFGVTNYWEHLDQEYIQGKNLIDAVHEAGVKHFVFSSLPDYHTISKRTISVPHYDIKAALEKYARSLDIPSTFVHLSFYYENFLQYFRLQKLDDENYSFGLPQGDTKLSMVSVSDVGGVVASIFKFPVEYIGRTVGIVGEDRSPSEYAHILSKVLRVNVTYNYISSDKFASLNIPFGQELANMFEVQRLYVPQRQMALIESYGLNPYMQPFERWVKANKDRLVERSVNRESSIVNREP
jgi:uncharacterized protein YbjT (DUF2867 family)